MRWSLLASGLFHKSCDHGTYSRRKVFCNQSGTGLLPRSAMKPDRHGCCVKGRQFLLCGLLVIGPKDHRIRILVKCSA